MLVFQAEDLALGMLLNYTCHPTWLSPPLGVGGLARRVGKRDGQSLPGGLRRWPRTAGVVTFTTPTISTRNGRTITTAWAAPLVETTHKILRNGLSFLEQPRLDAALCTYACQSAVLPSRRAPPPRRCSPEHPEPIWLDAEKTSIRWDWVYALSRLDYLDECQHEPDYDFLIQVFPHRQAVLVGVPESRSWKASSA
jgi:hypothetical protein